MPADLTDQLVIALSSRALFDFIDNNPIIEFHPSHYVNDPFVIAKNDNMVAINSAIEVDLTGQVNAEQSGAAYLGGTGGQVDFVRAGATLDAVRGWLRTGDLDPGALASSSTGLEVGVVTAPAAVVVPILDLAYLGKPGGYVWSTRRDVTVSVRLPAWMAGSPVTVGEVRAGETTSLDSTTRRSGDVLTISVPELQVGTILVVQPRPGP